MTADRTYPRWQRGDREYAILEALAAGLISTGKAVELFAEGGEPPLVEHDVLLPYEPEEDRAMSIPVAADLDQSIRRICEEHGVTREQLRPIAEQLLAEAVEVVTPIDAQTCPECRKWDGLTLTDRVAGVWLDNHRRLCRCPYGCRCSLRRTDRANLGEPTKAEVVFRAVEERMKEQRS